MGGSGGPAVYRESWLKAVGYDTVPKDVDKFLDLCRKLKASGHPAGFHHRARGGRWQRLLLLAGDGVWRQDG